MSDELNEVYHKPTFDNISKEKRMNILKVAIGEFSAEGFENANINTIAKKAQVSVGSLYKYFDTKADLFLTSVMYGISELEALLDNINSTDEDVLIKFEKLIRSSIEASRKNSEMFMMYNELTTERNSELGEKIAQKMETITAGAYKKAIVQGQKSGEVRTDIDPDMAAFMIDSLVMNIQFSYACHYYKKRYEIYAGKDVFEKDEFVIENYLKFIKEALKPR